MGVLKGNGRELTANGSHIAFSGDEQMFSNMWLWTHSSVNVLKPIVLPTLKLCM